MGEHGPYVSKWITFAASTLIQASAGLSYSFSVYAPTLKDTLSLSQTQLATVGSAVNLGGYFAIISGSVYDSLQDHHRLGPRLVVWMGCLCCFCGYLGMYLMASGQAPSNFLQLLIFAAAAGNMGTWFDTAALVTNLRNFKNSRGFVVGVLKSFLGLSSSVYTTLYIVLFEPDAVRFLLMLALVPTLLGAALSFGLNYVPFVEASEGLQAGSWFSTEGRFLMSFLLVAALALYQMASALLIGGQQLSSGGLRVIMAGMGCLLALAAGLPLHCGCGGWRAVYAHDYITTRESRTDDEEAAPSAAPCSPTATPHWEDGARGSDARLPGHATAHHRPVASSSSSRTGRQKRSSQGSRSRSPLTRGLQGGSSSSAAMPRSATSSSSNIPGIAGAGGGSGRRPAFSSEDEAEADPLLAPAGSKTGTDGKPAAAPLPGAGGGGQQHQQPAADAPLQLGSLTTQQMLSKLDFWLLFFQFSVAAGVCLAYLNNLGQLVVALEGGHDGQVIFVSLFSVANAGGRLLAGYVPEQHLHARGTPRTAFLTLTAAVTSVSCLAVAYANLSHLYIISLLLGAAFGAHWSLLPSITSDLFGLKHFAANYTTLQFAPAAGSYLLATRLTGWLYDKAAEAHGDPHECVGPDCFGKAFLVLSGLAALSSIACSLATSRSRPAYAAIAAHLRQVDIAEGHPQPGQT